MKKLDLNIVLKNPALDEKKKEMSPIDIAVRWLSTILARAMNEPGIDGRATKQLGIEEQRRYMKIVDSLEAHKDGIAELDNDDFNFLKRKFFQVKFPISQDVAEILSVLNDALNKADSDEKTKKED